MPACGQCGKDNPEGTAFCGYCASPLAKTIGDPVSPKPKPSGNPRGSSPQSRSFKPETRAPAPSGGGKGRGGFELLPWNELSAGQKLGRIIAAAVVLFILFFFLRGMLHDLVGGSGSRATEPASQASNVPITAGDRKDGIESLCKVFQIYGLPKTTQDAVEAARNAGELFKLAGNQSPERSKYILTSIVDDFRTGKLTQADCAQAGTPITTTDQSTDNSTPGVDGNNNP
jgi:hypothetical protein